MALIRSRLVCNICRTEVQEFETTDGSVGYRLICPCTGNTSWTFLRPEIYIRQKKLDWEWSVVDKLKEIWKIIKT